MKKSIISRKKSNKARLAAGVLAIILGMFPAATQAQTSVGALRFGIDTLQQDGTTAALNNAWWIMDPFDKTRNVSTGDFYGNWIYGDTNYDTNAGVSVNHLRLGYYMSDANSGAQRISLGDLSGSLTVTGWAGHSGQDNNNYSLAMRHYGGAATLTFQNYNDNGFGGPADTTVDGSVIYIGSATYDLRATTTGSVMNSANTTFNGPHGTGSTWRVNSGSPSYTNTSTHTSYIYFDNNYARNGGAIYNAGGTLNLERNVFGTTRGENFTFDLQPLIPLIPANLRYQIIPASPGSTGNHNYYLRDPLFIQAMAQQLVSTAAGFGVTLTVQQVLDALTAQGFNFSQGHGNHSTGSGGAIDNRGTLTINRSEFYYNTANQGGAIYNAANSNASGSLNDFSENDAVGTNNRGGAIYNAGTFTLSGTVTSNALFENTAIWGGAIFNQGTLSVSGTFALNEAIGTNNRGGAVYNDSSGTATFDGTNFYANEAIGGLGGAIYNLRRLNLRNVIFGKENYPEGNKAVDGGAIYNNLAGSFISSTAGTSFVQNIATRHGGAIFNNLGTIDLTGASFSNNEAAQMGGAIYTSGGTVTLTGRNEVGYSSNMTYNFAQIGGAIYNIGSQLNINHSTIDHNFATAGDGGGIFNNGAIAITGKTLITNNTADTGHGGGIFNAQLATVNLSANDESAFMANRSRDGGGAIFNDEGGKLTLNGGTSPNNLTFSSNKTGLDATDTYVKTSHGGAIYSSENGVIVLTNNIFSENKATGHGGGIYNFGNELTDDPLTNLTITGGNFQENVAGFNGTGTGNGGAIYNGLRGIVTIDGTQFSLNEAAMYGGAIYNAQDTVLTLKDVDFVGNTAVLGGAVYNDRATINVVVRDKESKFGDQTTPGADSIYFTGTGNVFNVNVVNMTNSLIMRGSMNSAVNSSVDITKTGIGTWEYRTMSQFDGSTTNFTIGDGTMHFISESRLNLDGFGGSTDSRLELSTPTHVISHVTGTNYSGTASLILQGDTSITTDRLVTKTGSSIVNGIVTIQGGANPSFTVDTARAFSLGSTPNVTGGSIITKRFDIDGDTTIVASSYNFQAGTELHFENSTRDAVSGDEPILVLRPTSTNNVVTMDSDIYVRMPTSFNHTDGTYGSVILAEAANGGYFNNTLYDTPTRGKFFVYNNDVDPVEEVTITPFTRSETANTYKGLTVTPNDTNTGSWIIFAVADQSTNTDVFWTGADATGPTVWDSVNAAEAAGPPATAKTNWSGMVHGIPVNQFLYGDAVFFTDLAAANRRTVDLAENVYVKSLTVTPAGTGYVFNLAGKTITATETADFGTATINLTKNAGSTIVADEIKLDAGSTLSFDTASAVDGDLFLTLTTAAAGVIDVASDILVTKPAPPIGIDEYIVLVETTNGTLDWTGGRLVVDGNYPPEAFERSATSGKSFVGVKVSDDSKAIHLTMVAADTRTKDLKWSGAANSLWAVPSAQNWSGTVGGHHVTTFLNGDSVEFGEKYTDENKIEHAVTNKTVNIGTLSAPGNVAVGGMKVTDSGYIFDLTYGTISASVVNYSSTDVSTGNIDFGDATIKNNTSGRTVTAAGTINFDGGNDFYFDLTGADKTGTTAMLNLAATGGVTGTIGDGMFYISGTPLTGTEVVVLVDVGATPGTVNIVDSGTIHGQTATDDRTQDILGLEATATQLLLKMLQGGSNTTLYWSGATNVAADASIWNVNSAQNWAGFVGGNYTEKFWTGDTVFFSDTYENENRVATNVDNKVVATAAGMTVAAMTVDGTGYSFDLDKGGITATTGDIDFQEAADISNIKGAALTATVGNIKFVGGTLQYNGDAKITATAGDIDFGSADVLGISGADAIKAGNDIIVNDGTFTVNGTATIVAGRDITVTTADIGGFTTGGTINATRNITVGDGAIDLGGVAKINAGRNINFGSADVKGISGARAIEAGRFLTFTDGRLEFGDSATIVAGRYIDLGDVNFGSDDINSKTGSLVLGTTVTSTGGAININGGNDFNFDLDGVQGNTDPAMAPTILTLNAANGVTGTVGNGNIYVYDVNLSAGETIVLVNTNTNSTVNIGVDNLYKDGELVEFKRDADPNATSLALTTDGTESQLLLTALQTNTNTELTWTGSDMTGNTTWDSIDTNGQSAKKNWTGTVHGTPVNQFLNGDAVRFTDLASASRRTVNLTENFNVKSLTVTPQGTGYVFNLGGNSITAAENIDFGTANVNGISGNAIKAGGNIAFVDGTLEFNGAATIKADGNINFAGATFGSDTGGIVGGTKFEAGTNGTVNIAGGNDFYFDLTGMRNGDKILDLSAATTSSIIGNGNVYVSNLNPDLAAGERIVLVDAKTGGVIDNTGTLYRDGVKVVFERDTDPTAVALGLTTNAAQSQLILETIKADEVSTDLTWTGNGGDAWDVNTTPNWKGTVAGFPVDKFLDGDTVRFDNTATTKTVTVVAGGVEVAGMTVTPDATDYLFDLTNGGIDATGNIDFGSADVTGVSDTSKITAKGKIDFDGGNIDLVVGSDAVIDAIGNIDLGNAALNISGYTPNETSPYNNPKNVQTLISSGGTLSGFTGTVTVAKQTQVDFLTATAYQEGNEIKVATTLTWYNEDPNLPAPHGTFTIDDDGSFTLGAVLKNQPAVPGWNGRELTKEGTGTLILTGNNEYTGGTTIDDGKVVAGHINALGTGKVANNAELEIAAGGDFDNEISGTGSVTINPGAGKTTELSKVNSYEDDTTVQSGTLKISNIAGAGANNDTKTVIVDSGAAFDLAFAGEANVNPCDDAGGRAYNQKITGGGSVVISGGGTFVLANAGNDYSGGTTISNGSSLIYDKTGALGQTSEIAINGSGNNAGTFTIGVSGDFDKVISGTGKLYVNPDRNDVEGTRTVTLSRDNVNFTGDTEVCSGILELTHINGTGNAGVKSNVILRDGTTLDFNTTVNGVYGKVITGETAGAGTVEKHGNSAVTLTQKNDYGRIADIGTYVYEGRLIAAHIDALGNGRVKNDAELEIQAFGNFDNRIEGSGDVIANSGADNKPLILSQVNSYTGQTLVASGTLQLTNLNSTGLNNGAADHQVILSSGARLDIANALDGTVVEGEYAKKIIGDGTLVKSTGGTITLSGNNEHYETLLKAGTTIITRNNALGVGTTTMEDGTTLVFGADRLKPTSSFNLNGDVTMDTGVFNTTIATEILEKSAGTLTKTGDGTLTLENTNNRFSGLNILDGQVTATDQKALGGGEIRNEAILELVVNDDTTLLVKVDGAQGTFIKSGSAKLDMGTSNSPFEAKEFRMNGGSLEVRLSRGDQYYVKAKTFTETKNAEIIGSYNSTDGLSRGSERAFRFLALDGAGSGDFSAYKFVSSIARVKGEKYFDADSNKLFFEAWLDSFTDAYGDGLSYNALQAADAADQLPEDNPLMEALTGYENEGGDMAGAFSSLHGEIYKTSVYATVDLQRSFNELLINRRLLCEHCREFKQFRGQNVNGVQRELWATFTGGGNFRTEFDRFSGYNLGRWGIAGGLEHNFARGFFTGVALGYEQADLDLSDLPQQDQFYAFRVAAYTNYTIEDVSLTGFLGYSKNWHDVERTIDFLGVKSRAKYDDDVVTAGFDIAKTYHWNNINIIPSVGMNYVHIRSPYVQETRAGDARLNVHSDRYDSLRVPIGVRTNSTFNIQGVDFTPEFRAFYVPELANDKVRGYTSFASAPGTAFLVDTGVRGRNGFRIGVGMQAKLFDFMSIGVDYDAEIWSRYSRHDVGANIKLRW